MATTADVVFAQRGNDDVSLGDAADYGEGGPGVDLVHGDTEDDDVVGGSFTSTSGVQPNQTGQPDGGDTLAGDAGEDVVLGDNGVLTRPDSTNLLTSLLVAQPTSPLTLNRVIAQRSIAPYDLGDSPVAGTSGADTITGGPDNDVLLGQGGNDKADGGSAADYVEGGQGSDLVLGGSEDDDVVGGSSATTSANAAGAIGQPDGADNVYGGTGSDLAIGDNGLLTRVTDGPRLAHRPCRREPRPRSSRAGASRCSTSTAWRPRPRPPRTTRADALSGQAGVDVILGQDGNDRLSGGGDDDYVEGEGGADVVHGDLALTLSEVVAAPATSALGHPGRRRRRHHGGSGRHRRRLEPSGVPRRQRLDQR